MDRRSFLWLLCGSASLLIHPVSALAARPENSFGSGDLDAALDALLKGQTPSDGRVTLDVPKIAENGAQVRVGVETDLNNVETISLLVEKNPVPLTSHFVLSGQSKPNVAVNLKVRETSRIIALVKADGKFYRAVREVRVTAGGCG